MTFFVVTFNVGIDERQIRFRSLAAANEKARQLRRESFTRNVRVTTIQTERKISPKRKSGFLNFNFGF